jgi:hypothetical protein
MQTAVESNNIKFWGKFSLLLPLLLFWVILLIRIPYSITNRFNTYSIGLFLILLLLYYLSFRLRDNVGFFVGFGFTMLLFALTLSYKWTSGFSDNFIIGGLLPYKDAKNYYLGANLLLQGLPLEGAGQASERPLFPGLLSSLLLITGHNLKVALAIIVQLAGIALYLSARQIRQSIGVLPASLYITCMYFYIRPLLGYTLSEVPGFMLGCVAFLLIWRASNKLEGWDLILGILTLLVAVSMRAGAFLIFPSLALWAGWVFRREKHFSWKAAAATFVGIVVGYYLVNLMYAQSLGIPPGSAFGNFSYALYGQVRGGTGWHSAIEELGTRNPASVYRAAWQFFLVHPISLFIGVAKSYRDFFLLGDRSIFPFGEYSWQNGLNVFLWLGILFLLVWGLIWLVKDVRSNHASLLLAGVAGVLLSIPFLPPIDGGARFYASTMPFFYVLPAVGLSHLIKEVKQNLASKNVWYAEPFTFRFASIVLLCLALVVPIATHALSQKPPFTAPVCGAPQKPFVIHAYRGAYIDLIKDNTALCRAIPDVCLNDFEKHNVEKSTDDYYQHLLLFARSHEENIRIIPAIDLVQDKFHYFYFPQPDRSSSDSLGLLMGCAREVETKNQSVYLVETIVADVK